MATAKQPLLPGELGNFSLQQEESNLENITHTLAGTTNLKTNPGLVQALVSGNATQQQSQAIDQYLTGLNAQRAVALASQGVGAPKINLTDQEQRALDAMGIPYQSVLYTRQDAMNDYASTLEKQNNVTFQRDGSGNVIVQNGQLQLAADQQSGGAHHGWFSSAGQFFHHLTHNPVTNLGGDVLNVLNKGWNIVDSELTQNYQNPSQKNIQTFQSRQNEMRDAGYDPSNPFSALAFDATGKGHLDTTPVENWWDQANPGKFGWDGGTAVQQAEEFRRDPAAWRQAIYNDPKYANDQGAAGQFLKEVSQSPQFQQLVQRLDEQKSTLGNALANALHIDNTKHPGVYTWASTGLDVAASFALDPTAIGLGAISQMHKSQLAIHDLADANGIARVLDPTVSKGMWARRAQNAVNRFATYYTPELLKADANGDAVRVAQLTTQASRENPALATLLPDFLGKNQIQTHSIESARQTILSSQYGGDAYDRTVSDMRAAMGEGTTFAAAREAVNRNIESQAEELVGKPIYKPVTQEHEEPFVTGPGGEPLDTYDKAVDYLTSRNALLRLSVAGRAAVESSLMPGAVSSYGFRRLRGVIAAKQVGRDLRRDIPRMEQLQALKNSDPTKFENLLTGNDLTRLLPTATDAVDMHTGEVIGAPEATTAGLPSQNRALTGAEKGLASQNLRRYGSATVPQTALGRAVGIASPTAIAARARLAVRRFSSFLPRDTLLTVDGAHGADIVDQTARTYLTKGDAAMLRGAYTLGDTGTRQTIIQGLIDQLGHSAGLTRTEEGRALLEDAKTPDQSYVHDGAGRTINGQDFGYYPGQMRTTFRVPSFREMQNHAAHIGLISGTLGRVLGSKYADVFGSQWRLLAIGRPMTATRAAIESWLNAAINGAFIKGWKAKAAIQDAGLLSGPAVGRTRFTEKLASVGPAAKVGQFYRGVLQRSMTPEEIDALQDLPDVLPRMITEYTIEHTRSVLDNSADATDMAREGFPPALLQFDLKKDALWGGRGGKIREGFHLQPTDGLEGADRYANALAIRVNPAPDVARAAIEALTGQPEERVLLHRGITDYGGNDFEGRQFKSYEELKKYMGEDWPHFGRWWDTDEKVAQFYGRGKNSGVIISAKFPKGAVSSSENATGSRVAGGALGKVTRVQVRDDDGTLRDLPFKRGAMVSAGEGTYQPAVDPVSHVIRALESPANKRLMDQSGYGHYYWKDGEADATPARSDTEIQLGKQQWASDVLHDMEYLLTSRDGSGMNIPIAQHILDEGAAPDVKWLMDHVPDESRPTSALAPTYVAKPVNGLLGYMGALVAWQGKGYQYLVERLINRTTTAPLFSAAYIEEKTALKGFQRQMAEQLGEEGANNAVKEIALHRAWERVALMVDDPQLKSQMDIVGRNFFAFSRATTTMIRRWGTTFYKNPAAARRMMLAWEGATHSGMVYTDQNGQKMFAFPGTGAMMMALDSLGSKIPAFKDIAMYPVSDLTGKVTQIIPGAANPFQFSLSPMITIPMQKLADHWPDMAPTWDELNGIMNGASGGTNTSGIAGELTPSLARPFFQALTEDDKNSLFNSAMLGAIANLSAAGLVPPADATSDQIDHFLGQVKDNTKANLFERALFSPFLFANPSNVTEAALPADYAFSVSGAKSLDAEYRTILNDVHGDLGRAKQIFLAMHPEGLSYTVPESAAAVSHAALPATQASLNWMRDNQGFLKKYPSVGAFFLPQDRNAPYSQAAYQAQLEYNLRIRKTPLQFYNDIRVAGAYNQYYAMQDQYNADNNAALAEGNQDLSNTLTTKWTAWKQRFGQLNPLWADKRAGSEQARLDAQDQLKTLTNMVHAGDVPSTVPSGVLADMIQAYGDYEAFIKSHPGTDNLTKAMHSQASNRFISWMAGVVAANPEVASIYNGVFRQLDSNLESTTAIAAPGGVNGNATA